MASAGRPGYPLEMKNSAALALVIALSAPLVALTRSSTPARTSGQEEAVEPSEPSPSAARFQGDAVKAKLAGAQERAAIRGGVRWLFEHQREDGSWAAGSGEPSVGVTSLALLALLGDGNSPMHGEHREAMARAQEWLLAQQDAATGRIGEGRLQEQAVALLGSLDGDDGAGAGGVLPVLEAVGAGVPQGAHSITNPFVRLNSSIVQNPGTMSRYQP